MKSMRPKVGWKTVSAQHLRNLIPQISEPESATECAFDNLIEIRIKSINRILIGTLNVNSLAPKFDQLSEVIGNNLYILIIKETKLDSSFTVQEFALAGYSKLYRLGRHHKEVEC